MKTKRIAGKNLNMTLSLGGYFLILLLWREFQQEWVRTLLVIWIIFKVVVDLVAIYTAANSEQVDIFKDKT